jgi:ribosomal protein L37AE/L43A
MSTSEKIEKLNEEKKQVEDDHSALPYYKIKARYWQGVLWCENLIEDWEMKIAETLQLPFAFCVHDKDVEDDGVTPRKPHVHIIMAFSNTTTYNHALNIFKLLGANAINTCQPCRSIRWCYDYLIHDTEDARKKNKHQYDEHERVRGNNFDIGFYEQVSLEEKREMLGELIDFIIDQGFTNLIDFTIASRQNDRFSAVHYQEVRVSQTNTLDKYCAANYKKLTNGGFSKRVNNEVTLGATSQQPVSNQQKCCPECGSIAVKRNGKTAGGTHKFICKDCSKSWAE